MCNSKGVSHLIHQELLTAGVRSQHCSQALVQSKTTIREPLPLNQARWQRLQLDLRRRPSRTRNARIVTRRLRLRLSAVTWTSTSGPTTPRPPMASTMSKPFGSCAPILPADSPRAPEGTPPFQALPLLPQRARAVMPTRLPRGLL